MALPTVDWFSEDVELPFVVGLAALCLGVAGVSLALLMWATPGSTVDSSVLPMASNLWFGGRVVGSAYTGGRRSDLLFGLLDGSMGASLVVAGVTFVETPTPAAVAFAAVVCAVGGLLLLSGGVFLSGVYRGNPSTWNRRMTTLGLVVLAVAALFVASLVGGFVVWSL